MAVSAAKIGYGATLEWNNEPVAELTRIGGVKLSRSKVENTRLDAPDEVKEYVLGLVDISNLEIEGNFRPDDADGQMAMFVDFWDNQERDFVITLPPAMATTLEGTAGIANLEAAEATSEGIVPFKASLKITGILTPSVGASIGLTTTFFDVSESALIVPDPANDVYDYVATVGTAVESVTITPIATAV